MQTLGAIPEWLIATHMGASDWVHSAQLQSGPSSAIEGLEGVKQMGGPLSLSLFKKSKVCGKTKLKNKFIFVQVIF